MLLALFVVTIIITLMYVLDTKGKVYGSVPDWLGQHVSIADYFRKLFYESGSIFPDFSLQLGAGQNFAQLIYYGVLRPEILVSYLFPAIDMVHYFILSSIFFVILSVEMFYHWLKKEGVSIDIAFFVSILFICSGPIIFHTHRHLIFINYLPWMILTFMGIKRYVLKQKSDMLCIGVVLMILSSYFYSVSAIFMCGMYAIYCVVKENPDGSLKEIGFILLKLAGHVILAIGISAVILYPVILTMMEGQREAIDNPSLLDLFKPDADISGLTYMNWPTYAFSAGLTVIAWVAILYAIVRKNKALRIFGVLVLLLILFPIFRYALNGLQYLRAKSLIPVIPIAGFLIANMLEDMKTYKNKKIFFIFILVFLSFFFIKNKVAKEIFVIDFIMLCVILFVYMNTKFKKIIMIYLILPAYLMIPVNKEEIYLTKKDLAKYENSDKVSMIKETLDEDNSLYRFDDSSYAVSTSNQVVDLRMNKTTFYSSTKSADYNDFYYKIMKMAGTSTNNTNQPFSMNPFFQGFMGVKYIFTQARTPYGYEVIKQRGDNKIIKNSNVLPLAYVSYDLMSNKDFNMLSYPYTLESLYKRTIVDVKTNKEYQSDFVKVELPYTVVENNKNIEIKSVKNGYRIKVKGEDESIKLRLNANIDKELLLLKFNVRDVVKANKRNTTIKINGITNKLSNTNNIYANHRDTFAYTLSRDVPWSTIDITFSKGEYTLENIEAYKIDGSVLDDRYKTIDALDVKENESAIISGKVNAKKDGYFVTSLPYQNGYEISVDGQTQSYEEVNTAFVGFPIKKGTHDMVIKYKSPGKRMGIIISSVCAIFACCLWFKNLRNRKGMKNGR